ncbi:rhodanese-like/PpiC domain-containing protein 12, chloroplastic isoform X2 [Ricinus communis]|uniref:rhodanese-like/PpiC domain-containing protein 12, chloroplastic isoform X2 n=1 Tax=Ricinus communis TaxID=3988 RepID=UPI00201AEE7E|nr:rhodanese-like/PpiC domain-containing protein 12, chloroplastic isoform X2 [Ricinus communis]
MLKAYSNFPSLITSPALKLSVIPTLSLTCSLPSHFHNKHSTFAPLNFLTKILKPSLPSLPIKWKPYMLGHPPCASSFSSGSGSVDGREILVQHLLVKEDDLKLLVELQQRIAGGEDLSDLAVDYSICPSKAEGGMLGWVRKGEMVPEFEEAAFNAPLNKVVKCKTKFGWHLLQVLSDREESVLKDIQPDEFHVKMQDPKFVEEAQLIDVREPDEVEKASLPGFQILPLRQFGSWATEIAAKFDSQKDTYVMVEECLVEVEASRSRQIGAKSGKGCISVCWRMDLWQKAFGGACDSCVGSLVTKLQAKHGRRTVLPLMQAVRITDH